MLTLKLCVSSVSFDHPIEVQVMFNQVYRNKWKISAICCGGSVYIRIL